MKIRWWMVSSALIGLLMLTFGVGNLLDPDDNGPLVGQLILFAVMSIGATVVAVGLAKLRKQDATGARYVAVGVLPGGLGVSIVWFPPVFAMGILAIVTAAAAARFRPQVTQSAHS